MPFTSRWLGDHNKTREQTSSKTHLGAPAASMDALRATDVGSHSQNRAPQYWIAGLKCRVQIIPIPRDVKIVCRFPRVCADRLCPPPRRVVSMLPYVGSYRGMLRPDLRCVIVSVRQRTNTRPGRVRMLHVAEPTLAARSRGGQTGGVRLACRYESPANRVSRPGRRQRAASRGTSHAKESSCCLCP